MSDYEFSFDVGERYYWRMTSTDLQNWRSVKTKIDTMLANDEPVYVKVNDARRRGAVGRIRSINIDITKDAYYNRVTVSNLVIGWDDRSNEISPSPKSVTWLMNHPESTGTIWEYNPKPNPSPPPPKKINDHLGEEIVAGDFVCFIQSRYGRPVLRFGTVTRITPKGTIFVNTLKLKDGERVEEVRCKDAQLVMVNEKLMQRLTLAKLSAI